MNFDLYSDIAKRTGGDIYVGVVGPVRTGKSTFIKRFMEGVVDNINDPNKRQRTIDELPQSADGNTIMTTQPKFVPNEAVKVAFDDGMNANIRMIDCVGYLVDGAEGSYENGKPRMVRTPWTEQEMPFEKAAELGTEKVIKNHSTIGVIITTDGSISGISREKYVQAEERVVSELKALGKPFVLVINSKKPESEEAQGIKAALATKYQVPVLLKNVLNMTDNDKSEILETVLLEFPIKLIDAHAPRWVQALSPTNSIVKEITEKLREAAAKVSKMRDYDKIATAFESGEYFDVPNQISMDAATGKVTVDIPMKSGLFYKVASEECGVEMEDDFKMLCYLKQLSASRIKTQKLQNAIDEVTQTGYGVVMPSMSDMVLAEPVLVKQGNQFGVKLKASAPSLHIIRVDVETEVSPIVGGEQQGEELVKGLMASFENDKQGIWNTNIFGRSLNSLVNDGLNNKLYAMPVEAKTKMSKTLTRIVNEGRGGVICILL